MFTRLDHIIYIWLILVSVPEIMVDYTLLIFPNSGEYIYIYIYMLYIYIWLLLPIGHRMIQIKDG